MMHLVISQISLVGRNQFTLVVSVREVIIPGF